MSYKNEWHKPSNIAAIAAVVISLVSLFVSIRGCVTADKSLEIANADFRSARSIVLAATINPDGTSLDLKAIDPSVALQEGNAVFPSAISNHEWPILPPDYRLHVVSLRLALQEAIDNRFTREPGIVTVSLEENVPLIINSMYIAKGEEFDDRSLYRIIFSFSFSFSGDDRKLPEIEFKGLAYVRRLDSSEDPTKVLDNIWHQVIK